MNNDVKAWANKLHARKQDEMEKARIAYKAILVRSKDQVVSDDDAKTLDDLVDILVLTPQQVVEDFEATAEWMTNKEIADQKNEHQKNSKIAKNALNQAIEKKLKTISEMDKVLSDLEREAGKISGQFSAACEAERQISEIETKRPWLKP